MGSRGILSDAVVLAQVLRLKSLANFYGLLLAPIEGHSNV